jgi:malonyl-CoA/methylmalonyl-CoA synthetase
VEAAIEALPGVVDAAVIGVPNPDFGEGVVAVVVPQAGARLDERRMQTALAGELAKYKLPKRIFFAEALPRNALGKVQKNELRKRHKGTFTSVAQ